MFQENLDVYFDSSEHGIPVVAGSQNAVGILESPDQIIGAGEIVSTEYTLWFKTGALTLTTNQAITANGVNFKVREVRAQDDGKISIARLTKI